MSETTQFWLAVAVALAVVLFGPARLVTTHLRYRVQAWRRHRHARRRLREIQQDAQRLEWDAVVAALDADMRELWDAYEHTMRRNGRRAA